MLKTTYTLCTSLLLASFLIMDPILGSHLDEPHCLSPSAPVFISELHMSEEQSSERSFIHFYNNGYLEEAKAAFEGTPALQDSQDDNVIKTAANLYMLLSRIAHDPVDKASALERARGTLDKFLSHTPHHLECLRLGASVSDLQCDQNGAFAYTNRILEVAGHMATTDDLVRKFVMQYTLGQTYDACRTWLDLVQRPDQTEFLPTVCLAGARVSSTVGVHELVVKSCDLLTKQVKSGPMLEEALLLWGNALVKSNRFKDAGDLLMMCSQSLQHERIINLVVIGNLYAKGKAYPEFFNTLSLIIKHNDAGLGHFQHVRKTIASVIKHMPQRLKREYEPKKLTLEAQIIAQCPEAFTGKPQKISQVSHDFGDFAAFLSAKLVGDCQNEAKEIMDRAAQFKNPALLTQKKPLFEFYKEILNPHSAGTSSSSSPSRALALQVSPLSVVQRALERMRVAYGRLVHADNMMTFDARKALKREATRSASSSAFEDMSPQELPNLRGEILRTHGLPLSAPKPSDSNVDWDSPAASSVPVVEEPPFVHTPLSVESLLSSKAYATFLNIMVAKHHSVTNQDIRTLIEALHATALFEKASYDKRAGHGSHAKVKLWREGTPATQRPKPVTLPKHEAAKDYTMAHLKALFEANGLTL